MKEVSPAIEMNFEKLFIFTHCVDQLRFQMFYTQIRRDTHVDLYHCSQYLNCDQIDTTV